MKECQNPHCRSEIKRDTAIYCPYCGQFQKPTGWHYDEQRYNIEIENYLKLDPDNFLPPKVINAPDEIKKIVVDGDILVTLGTSKVVAYNIVPMLFSQSCEKLWEVRIQEPAKIVILRPYVIIIDYNQIISTHLVTGEKKEILNFAISRGYFQFRDPDIILPVESLFENKRYPLLLILKHNDLIVIAFDNKNQAQLKHAKFNVEGTVVAMQVADSNSTKIKFCTSSGVTGEFSTEIFQNQEDATVVIASETQLFSEETRPGGGFRIEWFFVRERNTYFYIRRNDGTTKFYLNDSNTTQLIGTEKSFAIRKKPCFGKLQPSFIFEERDKKNVVDIYSLSERNWHIVPLDTSLYLSIKDNSFDFYAERVLYFKNNFWTICEADKEDSIPYKLMNLSLEGAARGQNLFIEKWNIADERVDRAKRENLPLLWNHDMLISFTGKKIILFKSQSD